jgi:pyrimidine-nucleoside phosphorylase
LFLRAIGAVVPKLGVPGRPAGGIDCLAQVPGYQTSLDEGKVYAILKASGYVHFIADHHIAPLDGKMFLLRQKHSAQTVPTLVAASLLSKKLAVGIRYAGLDIRVAPHGNFGKDWATAELNAQLFIKTARLLSIDAFPVLTEGRYPYQPFIGRCEALVALDEIFKSNESRWLEEHFQLCQSLALACTPSIFRMGFNRIARSELRRHFDDNLIAQGATPEAFDEIVAATRNLHVYELKASADGFAHFPMERIRQVLVDWQGRVPKSDRPFPDPVGLILRRRPGDWVTAGELLATARVTLEAPREIVRELEACVCSTLQYPLGPSIKGIHSDE